MLALTFQVGTQRLALDIHQVREVVPHIRLERTPGSPAWLAGLFVYRGEVVPVIDLGQLVGVGTCPGHLSSRIILVRRPGDPDHLMGLLAARVIDLQEVSSPDRTLPDLAAPGQPDLGAPLASAGSLLRLLDVDRLLPATLREQLPAPHREGLP
jgi:chemotaxis-related protein WspB